MRKKDELTNPVSCMNRAEEDEMTFVLLARDIAAPVAIRAWIGERVRIGKNTANDRQVVEAEECAKTMEAQRVSMGSSAKHGIETPLIATQNLAMLLGRVMAAGTPNLTDEQIACAADSIRLLGLASGVSRSHVEAALR